MTKACSKVCYRTIALKQCLSTLIFSCHRPIAGVVIKGLPACSSNEQSDSYGMQSYNKNNMSVKKLIIISSLAIYSNATTGPLEPRALTPRPYWPTLWAATPVRHCAQCIDDFFNPDVYAWTYSHELGIR